MEKSVRGGTASIVFLCSIGSFFIKLPLSSDDGSDIVAALFAFLLSAISVFIIYHPLCRLLSAENGKAAKKYFLIPFKLLFIGAVLVFAVFTLCELAEYTEAVVLQGRSRFLIFAFLAALALYIAFRNQTALSKTALVISLAVSAGLIIIFLFALSSMNFKYFGLGEGFNIKKSSTDGFLIYLKTAFEGLIIAGGSTYLLKNTKSALLGTAASSIAMVAAFVITLLVFGGGFAATLEYPFTSAVGIVGRGEVFSGMDGFLYIIIFLTAVFKSGAAFFAVKALAESLKKCKKI